MLKLQLEGPPNISVQSCVEVPCMSCSVSTQLSLIRLVLPVILRQGYFAIQLASMVSLFFSIAHFNRSIVDFLEAIPHRDICRVYFYTHSSSTFSSRSMMFGVHWVISTYHSQLTGSADSIMSEVIRMSLGRRSITHLTFLPL